MNTYKIVTIQQLADFISQMQADQEYSFSAEWNDDEPIDTPRFALYVNAWYGIKLVNAFDGGSPLVLLGYYGGGCEYAFRLDPCTITNELETYIKDYCDGSSVEGKVVFDTKRVR